NGTFALGDVSVDFMAERWKDAEDATGGLTFNRAFSLHFTVLGSTAALVYDLHSDTADELTDKLANGMVGASIFNSPGYLAVTFQPTSGHALDYSTINGDEVTLQDASGATIALGMPQRLGTSNTFTYALPRSLATGTYTAKFKAGGFKDDAGNPNLEDTQS